MHFFYDFYSVHLFDLVMREKKASMMSLIQERRAQHHRKEHSRKMAPPLLPDLPSALQCQAPPPFLATARRPLNRFWTRSPAHFATYATIFPIRIFWQVWIRLVQVTVRTSTMPRGRIHFLNKHFIKLKRIVPWRDFFKYTILWAWEEIDF